MRIAIFASDREERYALSRLAEKGLIKRGVLPEVALFPVPGELEEVLASQAESFALVIIKDVRNTAALKRLCARAPVILIGGREDGSDAFDMGVGYFIANPVDQDKLDRALARCLPPKRKKEHEG